MGQETKTASKEFKVRLHHTDPGRCLEVWEMQREGKKNIYVGREDCGAHSGQTLRDAPDGFCECDYVISRSVEFIICKETDSRRTRRQRPRTFRGTLSDAGRSLPKGLGAYPEGVSPCHTGRIRGVDRTFAPRKMEANEKWEWRDACKETTGREELCRFDYIGDEMVVFRLGRKHTKCEARWKGVFRPIRECR